MTYRPSRSSKISRIIPAYSRKTFTSLNIYYNITELKNLFAFFPNFWILTFKYMPDLVLTYKYVMFVMWIVFAISTNLSNWKIYKKFAIGFNLNSKIYEKVFCNLFMALLSTLDQIFCSRGRPVDSRGRPIEILLGVR